MRGDVAKLTKVGDLLFNMSMLFRSKAYMVVLSRRGDLFERGLQFMHQFAPNHYYLCLLHAETFDAINAVESVLDVTDAEWKAMLQGGAAPDMLEIVDLEEPAEAIADIMIPALPPLVPGIPPEYMAPQGFVFMCETTLGPKQFTIALDGFSHQSGHRRVYGKCPHENHHNCYRYHHVYRFDEPWMAVASIIVYFRGGLLAADKREHQQLPPLTADDLLSVKDEVPALMFVDLPDIFA
jgi:hypothetical protein